MFSKIEISSSERVKLSLSGSTDFDLKQVIFG